MKYGIVLFGMVFSSWAKDSWLMNALTNRIQKFQQEIQEDMDSDRKAKCQNLLGRPPLFKKFTILK